MSITTPDAPNSIGDPVPRSLTCVQTDLPSGWALLAIVGEVDPFNVEILENALMTAVTTSSPYLLVDLARVVLMDSSGLIALSVIRRHAHARGGTVSLVGASVPIAKLLQINGMDRLFPMHDTVADLLDCPGCVLGPGRVESLD